MKKAKSLKFNIDSNSAYFSMLMERYYLLQDEENIPHYGLKMAA